MIAEKLLEQLQKCIRLYDEKCGNDYVIVFNRGKKDVLKYCHITFNYYNFWHLMGCKLNSKEHMEAYNRCKKGEDISGQLSLVHSYPEAYTKCEIFNKVFDFVSNAKCMKIGYVSNCPEAVYLTMALGNEIGIIGYDYAKGNEKFMIPKTVQAKKMASVSSGLNKILLILSKGQDQKAYINVEYEIKKGVVKEYFPQISTEMEIDDGCGL